MKSIVLETKDERASLFSYFILKCKMEVTLSYNRVSRLTANGTPLATVNEHLDHMRNRIGESLAELDSAYNSLRDEFPQQIAERLGIALNHYHRIQVPADPAHPASLKLIARAIALTSLIFDELERIDGYFHAFCKIKRINPAERLRWEEQNDDYEPDEANSPEDDDYDGNAWTAEKDPARGEVLSGELVD